MVGILSMGGEVRLVCPCLRAKHTKMFALFITTGYVQHGTMTVFLYHTVNMTLAFLYQLRSGFSPLLVSVSSMYAHRRMKSSCDRTLVSFPVMAW